MEPKDMSLRNRIRCKGYEEFWPTGYGMPRNNRGRKGAGLEEFVRICPAWIAATAHGPAAFTAHTSRVEEADRKGEAVPIRTRNLAAEGDSLHVHSQSLSCVLGSAVNDVGRPVTCIRTFVPQAALPPELYQGLAHLDDYLNDADVAPARKRRCDKGNRNTNDLGFKRTERRAGPKGYLHLHMGSTCNKSSK